MAPTDSRVARPETPTSAPGNRRVPRHATAAGLASPVRRGVRGFTLIELLIVISLVAIASAVASLALRDPSSTQLEREATRLAALLESARAEARAAGLQVLWIPSRAGAKAGFRFVGLPTTSAPPEHWLDSGVEAEVIGARAAVLGPEPVIGAQRIVLRLEDQRLMLETDGLGPFVLAGEGATP